MLVVKSHNSSWGGMNIRTHTRGCPGGRGRVGCAHAHGDPIGACTRIRAHAHGRTLAGWRGPAGSGCQLLRPIRPYDKK